MEWAKQNKNPLEENNDPTVEAAMDDVGIAKRKYFVGPYYIDNAEARNADLQDIISTRLLCCEVDMTKVAKRAGQTGSGQRGRQTKMFHCTRIKITQVKKVSAWAQRFADETLEEDDDELPFSREDLAISQNSGELVRAGGSSDEMRHRVAL